MTKQTTKIAAIIILAIGLAAGAAAQSRTNVDLAQNVSLNGIETAKGTFDPMSNIYYGNSFTLNNPITNLTKSEPHYLTISLNYSCALDNSWQCESMDSRFSVVGGTWSLIVFRDNAYAGTLYGKVSGGTIDAITNRNGQPGFRQMQIRLQATGGLGTYADRRRSENISGVYEANADAVSNETIGSINFTGGLE